MSTTAMKVLLVDDEAAVLNAVRRIFSRSQIVELVTVLDPFEAMKVVAEREIALVISDQRMPGMTGLEFLAWVNATHPGIVKIIMTGDTDIQTAVQAINDIGVYKFIRKPWNNDDLYWTVIRALEMTRMQQKNRQLKVELDEKDRCLQRYERLYPGITAIKRDADGAIVIDEGV
ncbi:MAG: response regulator [Deltaproteobacteria bacterium]|nr:response regulator [Deltaproteobacteria bacterium]